MKDIKFSFLCGLPRAGNTLLACLFNTTNYIKLSPNSLLPDILINLIHLKQSSTFKNFPNHSSLDNIIKNVFDNYYKDWDVPNIIDRAPWGLEHNYILLNQIYNKPKIIILYRPVLEVLASFIRVENTDIKDRCDMLMSKNGFITKSLESIQNILNKHTNYIIIKYDDLICNTVDTCQNILNFLEIKEKFEIKDFNQYKINDIVYDDKATERGDIHSIRVGDISKLNYNIENYLSNDIIEKYKNKDIL